MYSPQYGAKWIVAICLVLAVSFSSAQSPERKLFGNGKPFTIDELPAGNLKEQLQELSPQARGKAMKWLQSLSFNEADASTHLNVDKDGGVFITCPGNGKCSKGCQHDHSADQAPVEESIEAAPAGEPQVEAATVAIDSPPAYNSKPGAPYHIYLDFNGAIVSGKAWSETYDNGTPTDTSDDITWRSWDCHAWSSDGDRTTFSDSEQTSIRQMWERVAEDYSPFNVNVTTDRIYDPEYTGGDRFLGSRNTVGWLLITPTTDKLGARCPHFGSGGVAYVGVYGNSNFFSTYQPAWVTDMSVPNIAEAASHEMGHNMGLSHDGTSTLTYYGGHVATASAPSWGPIMGTGYSRNVSQWSKASEYFDGNQTQDDLTIIANRIGYRANDYGNSFATASTLLSSAINQAGVIENSNEPDYFKFTTGAGTVNLNAAAYRCASSTWGANLDIILELYDSSYNLITSVNPLADTHASLSTSLAAGTYYVVIKPTGAGDPLNSTRSGYTVYGSVGQYTLTGNYVPVNTLVVGYPNGGEAIYHGESKVIQWGSGVSGNVKIELYKGGALHSTLAANEANDGAYTWSVSAGLPAASDYRIRVTSLTDSSKWDESDSNFSISSQPTLGSAVDAPTLVWSTSGSANNWFPQTATTHDGIDAAQSGVIGDNESTSMETTLVGPGTLTFWWKVSSESGWDFLTFFIGGIEQTGSLAKISGDVNWVQKTVSIPSGNQVVRWTYSKDSSQSANADSAWVDQVVYTPSTAPEIVVEQPTNTGLTDGASTINCGTSAVGQSVAPLTFTIRNTGGSTLSGLSVAKIGANSNDFTLGSLGATSLAAGTSTTFTVTFTPSGTGSRNATLQIASNDSDENPFDIGLTGTGSGPGVLTVTASGGLTSSGVQGGPFSPSSIQYTLQNTGGSSLNWSAGNIQPWVTLSGTSGSLAAGASTAVTVSINSAADALSVGSYSDTVTFTNITNTTTTTRPVALTVNGLSVVFQQNFDASGSAPANWISSNTAGSAAWAISTTASNARSVNNCFSAPTPNNKVTAHLTSPGITIPAAASTIQIRFWHKYNLQSLKDGGRMQLSLNDGAWFNIEDINSGASFGSNGYDGVIDTNKGNPDLRSDFNNLSAWTGTKSSYVQTIVNLTDLVMYRGKTLKIRWTMASDNSTASSYWYLDDVFLVTDAGGVTPYTGWSTSGGFANQFNDTDPSSNPDGDMLTNLQEFAFGTDPTSPKVGPLRYDFEGDVTEGGTPILQNFAAQGQAPDIRAVFIRRRDHAAAGLTYTVKFSAELGQWSNNIATPTVLTSPDSQSHYEAVSVPYPSSVPLQAGGNGTPKFFKVQVSSN